MAGHLFKRSGSLLKTTVSGHLARCPDIEFCCDAGLPASVTISGANNCYSGINGTFALTPHGSDPCIALYSDTFSVPANPCTAGTHCYNANETFPFPDGTRMVYWYPLGIAIVVTLSSVDTSVSVALEVDMEGYYINNGGFCTIRSLSTASMLATWTRATCLTGTFTESSFSEPPVSSTRPTSVSLTW